MNKTIKKLNDISEKGSIKDFDFLYNNIDSSDLSIKNLAIKVLYDIKDPNLVPLIGEKLRANIPEEKRISLLSVCWQSSLDFSEYFEIFINDATNGSLLMTIESMSVIENIINLKKIDGHIIKNGIEKIENIYPKLPEDIKLLISELLRIFNKL